MGTPSFDGPGGASARFFLTNAACWIEEYHLDAARRHATNLRCGSAILAEISARPHGGTRTADVPRRGERAARASAGRPLDQDWVRHGYVERLSSCRGGRLARHTGRTTPITWGRRGNSSPQPSGAFCIRANVIPGKKIDAVQRSIWHGELRHVRGESRSGRQHRPRVARSAIDGQGRYRMTALLLLGRGRRCCSGPEFGSRDHFISSRTMADLGKLVRDGRAKFLSQFPALAASMSDRSSRQGVRHL